jgi:SAM-dependent methyltransferase
LRTADVMRRDWDDRAQRNALFYIEDSRHDWNADSFFQSGEDDYCTLVAPVLEQIGFDPADKSMLELGCGAGRMSRSFANRFRSVIAVDISLEMLKRGQQLLPGASNIVWLQGNGLDLANVPSESADLAFSYLVLQHLPTQQLVSKYVSEIVRVLRPGGAFLFQFNSLTAPTMNLKGRIAWSVVDAFWSLGFIRFSRRMAGAFGFDPLTAGRAWRGATVAGGEIRAFVQSAGGTVMGTKNDGTSAAWCYGTKITSAHGISS